MKAFVGTGHGSPKDAVAQATQGLSAPQAILFMAPYDMAGEVAAQLMAAYPDTPSIGTIGTKLVNGQVSDTNVAVLGLFEDAKTSLGVIEHISECPVACAGEIISPRTVTGKRKPCAHTVSNTVTNSKSRLIPAEISFSFRRTVCILILASSFKSCPDVFF